MALSGGLCGSALAWALLLNGISIGLGFTTAWLVARTNVPFRRAAVAGAFLSLSAPLIARQIFDAIRTLNRQDGLTVLIVEQNANHALKLAHRGYVMVNGLITLAGTGAELLQRPEIRAAYLEGGRHG